MRKSDLIEPMKKTSISVGPGSYSTQSQFYKPQQSFFARDGMKPVKVGKNKGTIRSNFEMIADDSDEEGEMNYRKQSPGPGAY